MFIKYRFYESTLQKNAYLALTWIIEEPLCDFIFIKIIPMLIIR